MNIEDKDFGCLPSQSRDDYSYQADTNPPIPRDAVRHFIEYPEHAPRTAFNRLRIPKKIRQKISSPCLEAYGIYIQESINWTKVIIVEVIFSTCCVIFAVFWCIAHEGGIQDGFTIAGTGIAYSTIMLVGLQALAQWI